MPATRPPRDLTFLSVAAVIAQRSTCARLQVGCVLTDLDGERLWVGYNGGPRGGRNGCARQVPGRCGCVHAETNALIKADPTAEKVAYLTCSPCELCAVAMVNGHVRRVVYRSEYRAPSPGLAVLQDAGVEVVAWDWCIGGPVPPRRPAAAGDATPPAGAAPAERWRAYWGIT